MIHDTCIFIEYPAGAIAVTIFKWSRDLRRTIQFSKDIFHICCRKSFFLMVHRFYGLWYTLTASFVEYWTKVITDFVLNKSRDNMQFLSWYRANTFPNLRLVIHRIYDIPKWKSEYYEHFESFQLNIDFEKGFLACFSWILSSSNLITYFRHSQITCKGRWIYVYTFRKNYF